MGVVSGLRTVLARRGRDAECVAHGVVPKVHDGCMKCGAGTVATRTSTAVPVHDTGYAVARPVAGGVRAIDVPAGRDDAADDGDENGWDAGW